MKIGISTLRRNHELIKQISSKYDVLFMDSKELKSAVENGNPDHMDLILFDFNDGYEYDIIDFEFIDVCSKIDLPIWLLMEPWVMIDESDIPIVWRVETYCPEDILNSLSKWASLDESERKMNNEYFDLCGRWRLVVEQDEFEQYEELLQIIYDTFSLYKRLFEEDKSLSYKRLRPYKYVGQMYFYLINYAMPCKEVASFIDSLLGLSYLIESGFDEECKENVLPLKSHWDEVKDDSEIEADMTSFDSFRKSFVENTKKWQAYYEE